MLITELPKEVLVLIYHFYPYKEEVVDKWADLIRRKLNKESYFERRQIFYERVFMNMLRVYNYDLERLVIF